MGTTDVCIGKTGAKQPTLAEKVVPDKWFLRDPGRMASATKATRRWGEVSILVRRWMGRFSLVKLFTCQVLP